MRALVAVVAAVFFPFCLVFLAGGCSAIVSLSDDDIRCAITEGVDPCPTGRRCIDSFCQAVGGGADSGVDATRPDSGCVPNDTPELCNSVDDDCDGMVDEGHDLDGDGATWCGGGRGQEFVDCDDSNPNVRPSDPLAGVTPGIEECNGVDENCNGIIDEGAMCRGAGEQCFSDGCFHPEDCRREGAGCPAGQSCDTAITPPTCRPGDCTLDGCTGGQTCDRETKACVTPRPLGDPCATDAECADAVCVDRSAVGLDGSAPPAFCARSCCTDSDCPAASICWNSGTGAKLCVAEGLLMRTRGPGVGGAPCADGDQCASSICAGSGGTDHCLGNCSESGQCDGSLRCQLVTLSSGASMVDLNACLGPIGVGAPGSACSRDTDCEYGICLAVGTGAEARSVCGGSCGESTDCREPGLYCGFIDGTSRLSDVPICLPKTHSGTGTMAGSCTDSDQCNDRGCVEGRCLDSCCRDAQCGGDKTCRPYPAGGGSFRMRCSP